MNTVLNKLHSFQCLHLCPPNVVLDLPQAKLQVEPTVTRNAQEGESETPKYVSCEGTAYHWSP